MSKQKQETKSDAPEIQPGERNGQVALYGRWFPERAMGAADIRTTIDATTEEGKALIVSAASPGDLELDGNGRLSMNLCDVAVFWDSAVDEETGECRDFVRTVFIGKDGRRFRTSSPHAPHFIARLVSVYGLDRLKRGIPICVCERRSKREGRRYHDFRVELPSK